MKIQIIDCISGEVTERDMTTEELSNKEKNEKDRLDKELVKSSLAAQRQALLAKLGITEEEARLLLGGN